MTRTRYAANDGTIARARQLRRGATPAEERLWSIVRANSLAGHKFRRQQRLGKFYGDIVCQSARLVIEVDGDSHGQTVPYDADRTAYLSREGYRVIRFTNAEVMGNVEGVAIAILAALAPSPSPSHSALPSGPLPLPRGG